MEHSTTRRMRRGRAPMTTGPGRKPGAAAALTALSGLLLLPSSPMVWGASASGAMHGWGWSTAAAGALLLAQQPARNQPASGGSGAGGTSGTGGAGQDGGGGDGGDGAEIDLFGDGGGSDWLFSGSEQESGGDVGGQENGGGDGNDIFGGQPASGGGDGVPGTRGTGNGAGEGALLGSSDGIEEGDLFPLAFTTDMKVGDLIEQLHDLTGKPITHAPAVDGMSIPIVNGRAMNRQDALNLITVALFEAGVGVVDRGSYIALMQLTQINSGFAPLIGPDQSLANRRDVGMIAEKVYQVRFGRAQALREALADSLPLNAKYSVDDSSNQIVVLYNIGTLKRIEALIKALDVPDASQVMRTFRLQYADATEIAEQIVQLYGASQDQQSGGGNLFQPVRGRGGQQRQDGGVTQTAELKVVYNRRHNSVTVLAEPEIVEQIERNILEEWDVPVSVDGLTTRIYTLVNSDVIKVRDLLQAQFAEDEESTGTAEVGLTNQRNTRLGGGASRSATDANAENPRLNSLGGQFSFIADEDKNRLIVTARSPLYLEYMDSLIRELDAALDPTLPFIYELKYAHAEQLAIILNLLLAERGAGGSGLASTPDELSQPSFFNQDGGTGTTTGTTETAEEQTFWWQSGRQPEDERELSPVIGRVRIVPYPRQNALLVLTPPDKRSSLEQLIAQLDRPGRQVLLKATVVEVGVNDELELGTRWGSSNAIFDDRNPDNQIRLLSNVEAEEQGILGDLFDTSVLGLNFNLNASLQALKRDTDVTVLLNPKIQTSDNEEAILFDGQEVPFITNTQVTDTGQVINSFEYRPVGISLIARPRITVEGDVDMRISLELSSVVPGQVLFGGFILDRRQTTTKVTVSSGETIVLSGILRDEDNEIIRKVPILGDIPIINFFFRSKTMSTERTEIVAFITPIIVGEGSGRTSVSDDDRRMLDAARERGATYDPGVYDPVVPSDLTPGVDDGTGGPAAPSTGDAPREVEPEYETSDEARRYRPRDRERD